MTSLLRRKRQTTPPVAPARLARKITSAFFAVLILVAGANAQTTAITPKFVPVQPRTDSGVVPAQFRDVPPIQILPVAFQQDRGPMPGSDDGFDTLVRPELPGPQRLFSRETEQQFFNRLAQEVKKQRGGGRAIFPEDVVVSKQPFQPRSFPRMTELVEPSYVCHGRLYFEQPNFERTGYNFGVLTPAICLGVFYYDTALLPYHSFSNLGNNFDCSVGKCLPGDPAPFLVPRERFSVTGLVGQSGAMIGLGFLFP